MIRTDILHSPGCEIKITDTELPPSTTRLNIMFGSTI
nr:MAG TPA: hypothetical protein [Bacteriophage sp.]